MDDRKWIIWFCFFGPLGNLIPILPSFAGFKFYFIIIFLGNVYMLCKWRVYGETVKYIVVLLPIYFYMIISSMIGYTIFGNADFQGNGADITSYNPVLRVILTLMLLNYVFFLRNISKQYPIEERIGFIFKFFDGYIVSLIAGYMILLGYSVGIIDIDTIKIFEVLPQFAWGFLRFAPGSNANEYGILSSYALSIFTLLMFYKKRNEVECYKNVRINYIIYFLIICALFMTTTRAAYISYSITLLYIILSGNTFISKCKRLFGIGIIMVVVIPVMACLLDYTLDIDVFNVLQGGYEAITDENSTVGERYQAWENGFEAFQSSIWFGIGAGRAYMIHNTYLQFIFELGAVGTVLFMMYIIVGICKLFYLLRKCDNYFLKNVVIIGLFHILWFATNNHNLNQFLTWFVIFTIFLLKDNRNDKKMPN